VARAQACGVVLTTVPNRRAFRDPHYHLPLINWLPTPLAEVVLTWQDARSAEVPCKTGKSIPRSTPTRGRKFERVAAAKGFRVHDQVKDPHQSAEEYANCKVEAHVS